MLPDMVKEKISKYVEAHPGSTGIEIVCALFSKDDHSVDLPVILEQMVNKGLLTEMEYILSLSDYRVRSLFFAPQQAIELKKSDKTIQVMVNEKEIKSFPADTIISIVKQ